ncbi:hypothetical protein JOS77_20880 [Chromobacterium haemolyticum]|nr:hypothetical protein JOS77_20880 [Chromobacterium haemolyticum]
MDEGFQRQAAVLGAFNLLDHTVLVSPYRQNRVHQQVQVQAMARQQHGDGVDQERHIVVDHFNHGMGALPTVALEIGVVNARLVLTAQTLGAKRVMRRRGAEQVQR